MNLTVIEGGWKMLGKFYSTYGIIALGAWAVLTDDQKQALLTVIFGSSASQPWVSPLIVFVTLFLRGIKQGPKDAQ